jgi:hypothetical protein
MGAGRTIIGMKSAGHLHQPSSARPESRSARPWAVLATFGGALVLATIVGLKLEAVPELPAKIILGVSIAVFFGAALAAIPQAQPGPAARRAVPRPDDGAGVVDDHDIQSPSEDERVQVWQRTRLAELGVPEDVALVLAEDRSFSHHELKRLLAEGCPLDTALRILWPA